MWYLFVNLENFIFIRNDKLLNPKFQNRIYVILDVVVVVLKKSEGIF